MLERLYQAELIKKIRIILPGCFIIKNDSSYMQGIPDWIILWKDKWAMLEVKGSARAKKQPNQDYYIELLDGMSFAAFVHPGNEDEVLDALQSAFGVTRKTRISQR